ncbi:cellulose biosynthesis protein BcsN [Neorhizobium sp. NCHU2750]|uniref:cellulose biosynthesis protein BcsN n=1 Tax=Neorhizobium sp. NCHU2750 TaxID=1825976 RepID=UPI000E7643B0|nr:hypothetical protein NCHU2750_02280 [Neorhizobium sp. NCHU2750]
MTDRLITNTSRRSGMVRPGLAVLLGIVSLTLAGCGGKPIQPEDVVKSVEPAKAIVTPPPAGPAVVNVIQHRYGNAISQDIYLGNSASTPGQNMIKVQLFGTESDFSQSEDDLTYSSVTEGRILAEMRRALPRVPMARSTSYVQNVYGPFGYAFGRGAGSDLCFYAWQQIRSRVQSMSPLANYGVIQIRVRTCEANATEAKLLSLMYNFTINASVDALGWNPYGESRGLNPAIGGTGAPIYPRPASSEPIVQTLPVRQPAAAAPRRVQPARPRVAPQVEEPQFSPDRPRVPAPGGAAGVSGYPSASPASASSRTGTYATPTSYGAATAPAVQRVDVPSPSCAGTSGGTNVACR